MRRTLIAAALLVLVGCTSTDNGREIATPPSTTRPPITIGQDPSQPTTSAPPTSDWRVASTQSEVLDGLERNGFDVAGVKERDLEGGRRFGMVASWELRVASVPAFFHVFHSSESLEGWLETAQGMAASWSSTPSTRGRCRWRAMARPGPAARSWRPGSAGSWSPGRHGRSARSGAGEAMRTRAGDA